MRRLRSADGLDFVWLENRPQSDRRAHHPSLTSGDRSP